MCKKIEEENRKLKEELEKKEKELFNAQLQIENLKRIIFGSRREKVKVEEKEDLEQCSLFDDAEKMEENVQEQIEENIEKIIVHRKKNKREKQAGIKRSNLKNVEVEKEEYILNEEEKECPECGKELKLVSKKVVRQEIEYIPAKLKIKEYVQGIYKCEECGTKNSQKESSTFVKAEMPRAILAHSFASPSLATEVIYQKYYLGVPLYRQEKMWDDKGLVLPRNMMANWNIKLSEYYLEDLYHLMHKKIKAESELLHCDETIMQCNKEAGRKATSNSYMWVLCSGELEKERGVIFKYSPSRSGETAKEFLKEYKGILVTDGYASYNNIEGITHAECWAHARRYFYESIPMLGNKQLDTTATGYKGVSYCDELFKIEREIALLSEEEKVKKRKEESKPITEEFFKWVKEINSKVIVNNKLKEAITYAMNQEKELSEFLNDGKIPLTNSLAERAIRPFAVHRKNWLFADSVEGAKANAVYYSLIESAKINKLNIEKYIKYLLEKIPQMENPSDEKELEKYLPWSKELPEEILNFQGAYEELKLGDN